MLDQLRHWAQRDSYRQRPHVLRKTIESDVLGEA